MSSTGENEGTDPTVLTNGNADAFWSSLWDATRTFEYVVIDLGKEVEPSLLSKVLVNFQNKVTYCKDYTVSVSKEFDEENPDEGFVKIGETKSIAWEVLQHFADRTDML